MINFLVGWLVLSFSVSFAAALLPGVKVESMGTSIGVSAVYGLLSATFGNILFHIIGFGSWGLGYRLGFLVWWLINGMMLYITSKMISGFEIKSFKSALLMSAAVSLLGSLMNLLLPSCWS